MVPKASTKIDSPAVSVLMSVYNADKYVASAIESILNQTFKDFELIIVDDCSSDNSWDIIRKYKKIDKRIKAVRNKRNIGGCRTLNEGLRYVRGRYVARADNDDLSMPERLGKQFKFMEQHPEIGIVGGTMEIIQEDGLVIARRKYNISDSEIRKKIFRYSPFSHPLVMFRKSIIDLVGNYDPKYAPADDYDLYFRIGKKSKFANIPDVLLQYRNVGNSMTHNLTRKMELATIRVRLAHSKSKHYKMSALDRLYTYMQFLSVFIVPGKLKINIFNKMRNAK